MALVLKNESKLLFLLFIGPVCLICDISLNGHRLPSRHSGGPRSFHSAELVRLDVTVAMNSYILHRTRPVLHLMSMDCVHLEWRVLFLSETGLPDNKGLLSPLDYPRPKISSQIRWTLFLKYLWYSWRQKLK